MSNYRYTIISFNFDNYEIIREIKNPLPDVEYVYVTNDKNTTSNTWNVVIDTYYDTFSNSFDKVVEFRRRVLDYCHTDVCCRIDGSIQITGDAFEKTIEEFNNGNYDIAFIMHPWINTVEKECLSWVQLRGTSKDELENVMSFFEKNSFDPNSSTVYTLGIVIQKNNDLSTEINERQYKSMCELKEYCKSENFYRCDQAVFTYVMDTYFNNLKVMPLHYTILERDNICSIFQHKSPNIVFGNKVASFNKYYNLFAKQIDTVFNGDKWISLLTNIEIFDKATKILLKIPLERYSSEAFSEEYRTKVILPNKESYKEWLTNEDIITIGSSKFKDFQYNDPYNKHHYTIEWYYKKLLPILVSELNIPYNENDFVEVKRNNIFCKIPKEIQKLEVYCPIMKPNNGNNYIEVFYDINCIHAETSKSVFMSDSVYQPEIFHTREDDFHKIFKYCHFPVKIINYTCRNNDAILVIGNSHTIPFISILTKYYYTVVVIDNRLCGFLFDFMFSYIDFKNILMLGSYEINEKSLINVTSNN